MLPLGQHFLLQFVFDEILKKYTTHWTISKIKSSNFGTMFEISFNVTFKKGISTKEMLDEFAYIWHNVTKK